MPNPNHDKLGRFASGHGYSASNVSAGQRKSGSAAPTKAETYAYAQMNRPALPSMDKMMAGTLTQHQYPDEVKFPLYHGSKADFRPGDLVEPGHPGNFVRRMTHVYAATTPEGARQYGSGKVYEVSPLGPIGHRRDAKAENGYYASEWPLKVIRRVS